MTTVPTAYFAHTTVYAKNGSIDKRATLAKIEEDWQTWVDGQGDLKPAILSELKEFANNGKVIGQGRLVNFVIHSLRLEPTKEVQDQIVAALEVLQASGQVVYKGNEEGKRNGRGTGWTLPPPAPTTTASRSRGQNASA